MQDSYKDGANHLLTAAGDVAGAMAITPAWGSRPGRRTGLVYSEGSALGSPERPSDFHTLQIFKCHLDKAAADLSTGASPAVSGRMDSISRSKYL